MLGTRVNHDCKHKYDDTINERFYANEKRQHGTKSTEEPASPTVALDLVLITSMIDAMEGRDMAVADFPGNYWA